MASKLDGTASARNARTMPVPTPQQYAAMLDAALDGGYAYPAVNVTSSQTLNAALRGFAQAGSDGIVQVTVGGAKYLGGARAMAAFARELDFPGYIALHTDHCPPEQVDGF